MLIPIKTYHTCDFQVSGPAWKSFCNVICSKAVILLWIIYVISVLCLLCFHVRLFIDAMWSSAGKGLTF